MAGTFSPHRGKDEILVADLLTDLTRLSESRSSLRRTRALGDRIREGQDYLQPQLLLRAFDTRRQFFKKRQSATRQLHCFPICEELDCPSRRQKIIVGRVIKLA